MKRMLWAMGLLMWSLFTVMGMVTPSPAAEAPAVVVGRIFYIEGDLLRHVPEVNDWVAEVKDAPFGAGDTLFSGSRGMAELIVPNGTWIRVGNGTQIQFIALEADLTGADLASGMGRFYNKGPQAVIKATSPIGDVLADPGTAFDFYVGETSVEVVAIKGTVSFLHSATGARYDVTAGSPSILADSHNVSSGEGTPDMEWNRWNAIREDFWAEKGRANGPSAEYLPPALDYDASAFDENGVWESVPYEGAERRFWRPTTVAVGWSPFTVGRWTDWYGDQTWIPMEPCGYITHHYGNWIYMRNRWYWAPPAVRARLGLPLLDIGFFWYPGRVSWIHSGVYVGWVPLAPHETYYCRRHWGGPRTVVVTNVNITQIRINVRSHAFIDHAVIVNRNNFYDRNSYRNVRVTNINRTTLVNSYRAAPVVNNTVISNYTADKKRYNYTNIAPKEKPHSTVISRIRHNEVVIHGGREERAVEIRERLKKMPQGRINREARIELPKNANYIVPANQVYRPKSEMHFPEREIRGGGRGAPQIQPEKKTEQAGRPERMVPARPAPAEQPAARPERAIPARPTAPGRPGPAGEALGKPGVQEKVPGKAEQPGPGRVVPARPAPSEQPAAHPERAIPARPTAPGRPGPAGEAPGKPGVQEKVPGKAEQPGPGRVVPARPASPERPSSVPERAVPARPAQPERPVPERVIPARPAPSEQPAARPERVIPARPAPPERPSSVPERPVPERVIPARPAPSEQPAARPERVIPARPAPPERPTPERIIPARPIPPQQPAPEHVAPARPAPADQPAARPERVAPAKPAPPEQPEHEHAAPAPERPGPREKRPGP